MNVWMLEAAAAARLTTAGKVAFAVVPILLGGFYLYLFWCLARGRIAVRLMEGGYTTWVERSTSPREFRRQWWWSFGGLTLITIVLVGGLARLYWIFVLGG